jgi:hypothetical protein
MRGTCFSSGWTNSHPVAYAITGETGRRDGNRPAGAWEPIGAAWLLLTRLGVAPRDLSALTVFLATGLQNLGNARS